MTLNVRVAVAGDIPQMHEIRMSVAENRLSDPTSIELDDYRRMMSECGCGWVCIDGGRIIGFAVADLSASNVWALFIDPAAERRGAGRALHQVMMDWMFASGANRVWLGTGPGTRASQFYELAGWELAGTQPNGELRYEMTRDRWSRMPGSAPKTIS